MNYAKMFIISMNQSKMKIEINKKYSSQQEICDFINNLQDRYDKEGVFLYNKRNSVKAFDLLLADGSILKLVVKRFRKPNTFQRIIYSYLKKSKARRSYVHAVLLRERGFNTPQEIAYVEDYHNSLLCFAYYICEYSDEKPIEELYEEGCEYDRQFADDFAVFLAQLHRKNILHDDLNSTNVIYSYKEGHFSFSLIDLNRMRVKPLTKCFSRKMYLQNLTRFCGRTDLYTHVLYRYAESREWNVMDTLIRGLAIKKTHDDNWKRRKSFTRKLKHTIK